MPLSGHTTLFFLTVSLLNKKSHCSGTHGFKIRAVSQCNAFLDNLCCRSSSLCLLFFHTLLKSGHGTQPVCYLTTLAAPPKAPGKIGAEGRSGFEQMEIIRAQFQGTPPRRRARRCTWPSTRNLCEDQCEGWKKGKKRERRVLLTPSFSAPHIVFSNGRQFLL